MHIPNEMLRLGVSLGAITMTRPNVILRQTVPGILALARPFDILNWIHTMGYLLSSSCTNLLVPQRQRFRQLQNFVSEFLGHLFFSKGAIVRTFSVLNNRISTHFEST